MKLSSKDLLGIKELTKDEIILILDTASGFKDVLKRDIKKVPALRGKTAVNLFLSLQQGREPRLNLQKKTEPRRLKPVGYNKQCC